MLSKTIRDWILAGLVIVSLGTVFVYFKDLSGQVHGNATTATSLAANPSDCQPDTYANAIDDQANLSCAKITDNALSANIPRLNGLSNIFAGQIFSNQFVGNLSGNADSASQATQLAADPTDCAPGAFANAISSFGNLACSFDGSSLNLNSNVALLDRNNQNFTGNNNFTHTVSFNSHVNLGNDVHDVIKTTGTFLTYNGIFAESGGLTVNGGDVNVNNGNNVSINDGGTLYVDGTSILNDDVTFNGRLLGANGTGAVTVGHFVNPVGLKVWGNSDFRGDVQIGGFGANNASLTVKGDTTLGDSNADAITVNGRLFGNGGAPVTVGRLSDNNDFKVWGNGDFRGDLTVGGFNAPNGSLDVRGDSTLGTDKTDKVTVNGRLFGLSGGPVTVGRNSDQSGFKVWGDTDLRGALTVGGFGSVNDGIDVVSGDLNVDSGNLSVTGTGLFTGNVTAPLFIGNLQGNADTATALFADPSNCNPSTQGFATGIQADGTADCSTDGSGLTLVNADTLDNLDSTYFLDASNINAGTLNDARLSSNVALKNIDNNFSVAQTINGGLTVLGGYVGIGGAPTYKLDLGGFNTVDAQVRAGSALLGSWTALPYPDYAFFGNSNLDQTAYGNYALLQSSDGETYLNASSGKAIHFRIDNGFTPDVATLDSTGLTAINFFGPLTGNASTASALAADGTNCDPSTQGFAVGVDASGNGQCSPDGSGLTGVNADSLGTVLAAEYLLRDGSVAMTGALNLNSNDINSGGTINATTFNGGLTGNVTGNVSGSAGSFTGTLVGDVTGTQGATVVSNVPDGALSGNVTLQGNTFNGANQLVQLDGVGKLPALDGSALTNLTMDAGNLTGATLNATVVNSSLTSVGTLLSLASVGTVDFSGADHLKAPFLNGPLCDAGHLGDIAYNPVSDHFYGCRAAGWAVLDN